MNYLYYLFGDLGILKRLKGEKEDGRCEGIFWGVLNLLSII